jgi:hypothetical protein
VADRKKGRDGRVSQPFRRLGAGVGLVLVITALNVSLLARVFGL